jgi:hypothetical protein
MTHPAPNEFMLKKTLGSRVIPLDLPQILNNVKNISEKKAVNIVEIK